MEELTLRYRRSWMALRLLPVWFFTAGLVAVSRALAMTAAFVGLALLGTVFVARCVVRPPVAVAVRADGLRLGRRRYPWSEVVGIEVGGWAWPKLRPVVAGRRKPGFTSELGLSGSIMEVAEAVKRRRPDISSAGRYRRKGNRLPRVLCSALGAVGMVPVVSVLVFGPWLRGVWLQGPGSTSEVHGLLGASPGLGGGEVFILSVRAKWASPVEVLGAAFGEPWELAWRPSLRPPPRAPSDPADDRAERAAAVAAGLRCAGSPVAVGGGEVEVGALVGSEPVRAGLRVGDRILSVQGAPVRYKEDVFTALTSTTGSKVAVVVERRTGEQRELQVPVNRGAGGNRGLVGVALHRRPVSLAGSGSDLTISARGMEGDSLGLALALAVADVSAPGPVVGVGERVAATGTISPEGVVGPVGGIPEKMAGARRVGATVVLVPASQLEVALRAASPGQRVVGVQTLAEALGVLGRASCA